MQCWFFAQMRSLLLESLLKDGYEKLPDCRVCDQDVVGGRDVVQKVMRDIILPEAILYYDRLFAQDRHLGRPVRGAIRGHGVLRVSLGSREHDKGGQPSERRVDQRS